MGDEPVEIWVNTRRVECPEECTAGEVMERAVPLADRSPGIAAHERLVDVRTGETLESRDRVQLQPGQRFSLVRENTKGRA